MKKLLILAAFALGGITTHAQDAAATVEKSIFYVQPGFLGVYVNNESRLADKWALRTEIALMPDFQKTAAATG